MITNIAKILITELQMNIDFMLRIRDNFNSGIFEIPVSFFYHISAKYSIPMSALQESKKQIVEFILPMFIESSDRIIYDKKVKVKDLIDELPLAEFTQI